MDLFPNFVKREKHYSSAIHSFIKAKLLLIHSQKQRILLNYLFFLRQHRIWKHLRCMDWNLISNLSISFTNFDLFTLGGIHRITEFIGCQWHEIKAVFNETVCKILILVCEIFILFNYRNSYSFYQTMTLCISSDTWNRGPPDCFIEILQSSQSSNNFVKRMYHNYLNKNVIQMVHNHLSTHKSVESIKTFF